jgi:hypothetical protein
MMQTITTFPANGPLNKEETRKYDPEAAKVFTKI